MLFRSGGPEALPFAADFVVANMTGTELGACLPSILAAWNRRGPLVLSGMRPHEVAGIEARLPGRVTHRQSALDFRALVLSA